MSTLIGNEVFIETATLEYPLDLYQIRQKLPNVSFGTGTRIEDLSYFGFEVVQRVDPPTGDVPFELAPVFENGVWKQVWDVRPFTPEEIEANLETLKQTRQQELTDLYYTTLEAGIPYDFGGVTGFQTASIKDEDRLSYLMKRELAEGIEINQQIRTKDNQTLTLDSAGIRALFTEAQTAHNTITENMWALQAQIEAAQTEAEVPTVS